MKKATKFTLYLSVWIIVLCSVGMLMTFVNDYIQSIGFFGDIKRATKDEWCILDPMYDWGARHYWYFWMCFLLFAVSLLRVILWIINYWEDEI
jgi:hypothetical protein